MDYGDLKKNMSGFYNFHPDKIKIVSLVPIGRSSSIFFQGLLDGHPEIITILGNFYPDKKKIKGKKIDEILEYIYNEIYQSISHYNTTYDLKTNFPFEIFVDGVKEYTDAFGLNTKTLYIGAHYSYAKHYCSDMKKIRYILAHCHGTPLFSKCLKDFPRQRVIFTVRDPRANFSSFKKIEMLFWGVLYQYENYVLYEKVSKKYKQDVFFIKHEDMHTNYPEVKKKLARFLGILNSRSLDSCSFFNLPYDGSESKISSSQNISSTKPDKKFVNDKWKQDLSTAEIRFIQFVFNDMMSKFNYGKINTGENINIKFLNTGFNELSKDKINQKIGMKKTIFIFLRTIYSVPLLGPMAIGIFLSAFYFIKFIHVMFRVYLKRF